jgi:hypothetical protein
MRALAFRALVVNDSPLVLQPGGAVSRTIAVREDQTLEQLHEALRLAFGWADPHLYCFWTSGRFWDPESVRYSAPFELDEDDLSARVPVRELGLRKGAKIAYLFDFGDEWRLELKLIDTWPAGEHCYPMLVDAAGVVPPQYVDLDEDDDDPTGAASD